MAITISGYLNRSANIFQAGNDSTGFGFTLGVQYYDRETKQKEWTNYKVAVFAKAPAQVQYYQQTLVEGSFVVVSAGNQKIDSYEGQNGTRLSIELIDAKVDQIVSGQKKPQQQGQGGFQQQQQQVNQQIQQPQQPQQPQQQQQQGGFQQQQPQQQGGFQQQPQQGGTVNPMKPPVDFDDDIPF